MMWGRSRFTFYFGLKIKSIQRGGWKRMRECLRTKFYLCGLNCDNVSFISVRGNVDRFRLKQISEEIESDFLNSGMISQVRILGDKETEFAVEIRENDLLKYNLISFPSSFYKCIQTARKLIYLSCTWTSCHAISPFVV